MCIFFLAAFAQNTAWFAFVCNIYDGKLFSVVMELLRVGLSLWEKGTEVFECPPPAEHFLLL